MINYRLEIVEYDKILLTDGATEKVVDADLETPEGKYSLVAAVFLLMGDSEETKGHLADAFDAFAKGATSFGPTVQQLRDAAAAVAWQADHPDEQAYRPFPVEVLPPVLAELVSEGAAALGCDPAQIALPALAACSIGLGNSRRIILKSSWLEPAVVWAAVVLPSGALKSPSLDLALEPIRTAQAKAIATYKAEQVEYEARHGEWEEAKKKLRGPEPTPPVCSRIAVSDTTIEALADRLQAALRGLLCERDELSGWLKSFNQYKAKGGADVAHWLTMHRAGGLLMDRKSGDQKIIFCPMAFVAVAGTVQPGTLRRCLTPEYRESGLAARLLLAMPPVRRRQWSEATVSERTRKRYAAMLAALLAIPMGGALLDPAPVDMPMTKEAKAAWIEFYNAHNLAEQASEGGDLAAAWSKLEGYAARLALILHHVRLVSGEDADTEAVDAVSMKAGIAIARWFAGEAERVYAMLGGDAETDEYADLVDLIQQRGGRITARELSRASRRYREDGTAREALCQLAEAGKGGWIELPPGKEGGRPVTVFELAGAVTQPPLSRVVTPVTVTKPPAVIAPMRVMAPSPLSPGKEQRVMSPGGEDDRDYSDGNPDVLVEVPA